MSMIFPPSGVPGKVVTPLSGHSLPPAAASPPSGGEGLHDNQLPKVMQSLTEGEMSERPVQEEAEAIAGDSDPQQLLELLLATPVTMASVEPVLAVTALTEPQLLAAGLRCDRTEIENAGLLRNSIRATGHLPGTMPLMAAEQALSASSMALRAEAGNGEAIQQNAPQKLVTAADALLSSQSVKQALWEVREPLTAENPLQHPAPALVNTLMKGEATVTTLPTIVLPTAPTQQAEALQKALAERLEMQIDRHVQKATIRLDPPNLGKVDISIHFESGKLQVQIQAVQPEVTRLLQQISNEMRVSLSEQNNVQVNVQVSTQNGDSRQHHRQHEQPETDIAKNSEEITTTQRGTDGTILTMA